MTSGWWRASCDLDVVCGVCEFEGDVRAVEDFVNGVPTATWKCPECGTPHDVFKEEPGEDN